MSSGGSSGNPVRNSEKSVLNCYTSVDAILPFSGALNPCVKRTVSIRNPVTGVARNNRYIKPQLDDKQMPLISQQGIRRMCHLKVDART